MEDLHTLTLVFLIFAGFLAGFIDAVVGGGGLISTPALLFTGLPPNIALGTNKLAGTMGALTSTLTFIRSKKVDFHLIGRLFPLTLIGSFIGVMVVHIISPEILKPLILILLALVTIYTIFKKDWGTISKYKGFTLSRAILFGLIIFTLGFYDGFLGGGTGSFLLFSFLAVGFDFLHAAGNAKILNFCSNIMALITFICLGSVNFQYGIPMAISMIIGSWIGANVAIRKGSSYVKLIFIVVTILLIGKNLFSYLPLH
ncbi:TSUP family transporter [Terrilactibacillus sp. BCM23-1]|uniref:Probable membrane transporter protein n=1 Tax=Terrilactibacillus tamarindi TaxID=2599694 RepID=A0A6N8CS92_9BACI|nr:TSUP family transporter [Terrilactibacillus tamarindi]MTT32518.1 TSUP family transporter [Terrilactibacillus tamarindi]